MTIRPSSLPMLAQCPCFESDSTEFAEAGDKRHRVFKGVLGGDDLMLLALPEDESDGVMWAANFVKMTATKSEPLHIEEKLTLFDGEFNKVLEGTPDVVCGNEIFDLKWRERNYDAQMAAYALVLMQARGYESVTVHLLFAERQRVQKLHFNKETAGALVFGIISKAKGPTEPTPCDYCGWCANRLRCPALVDRANAVAAGREDWKLEQWHTSKVSDPTECGKMLALARELKPWCEAAEHFALELSKTNEIPGFGRKERRGAQEVKDIAEAHRLSGLPGEQFIRACKVSIPTLAEVEAEHSGTPKAAARKAIEAKLAPVLERRPSSFQLVKIKA